MKEFVGKMLELGAELDKVVSPIEISMVVNDAEILYKNHKNELLAQQVNGTSDNFEKDLFNLINEHISKGLTKPELIEKMKWVSDSCKFS